MIWNKNREGKRRKESVAVALCACLPSFLCIFDAISLNNAHDLHFFLRGGERIMTDSASSVSAVLEIYPFTE